MAPPPITRTPVPDASGVPKSPTKLQWVTTDLSRVTMPVAQFVAFTRSITVGPVAAAALTAIRQNCTEQSVTVPETRLIPTCAVRDEPATVQPRIREVCSARIPISAIFPLNTAAQSSTLELDPTR